jgi:hypothetical protein
MDKTQEALKMAIEAMSCISQSRGDPLLKAIRACKEALEQPVCKKCGKPTQQGECFYGCRQEQPAQEPVAWMSKMGSFTAIAETKKQLPKGAEPIPLYTHPHQWQGLTDDEINKLILNGGYLDCVLDYEPKVDKINVLEHELLRIARAIEQALKEKNT